MTRVNLMNSAITLPRHKLRVTDYHQMIKAGILSNENNVELIDGDLIEMAPAGPEHADFVAYLGKLLRSQTELFVREEKPVTLPEHSEPEPDLALVKAHRYTKAHPYPDDILMIIEVADSSLEKDKYVKLPLYARFQVPEVWVVDVRGGIVESFWEPDSTADVARYIHSKRDENDLLTSETIPGISLNLNELWNRGL